MTDQQERGANTCALIIDAVERGMLTVNILAEMVEKLTTYLDGKREGAA